MNFKENMKRSIIKTLTYRVIILILDFTVIFLLTGRYDIALGFMLLSNFYTSIAYFLHERLWDRISWGKKKNGSR